MGLGKKTIDDENYAGKRVLVRCDFNVPMKDGVITNDNRINAALPTIKKLINDGAKVILCSHLGKPKNGPEAKFSLAPVAVRLSEKLGQPVVFADDDTVVGENAKAAVATMATATSFCCRTPASARKRPRMSPLSAKSWPASPTLMSTMPSAPATALTAPPPV